MAQVFMLIAFSFLLTLDGLTCFPNKQPIEKPCENCTSTVVPHDSVGISTEHPRPITIQASTDGPTLLVVVEEDSSSDSSEEIIVGELIEWGQSNTTLSSSEELINPEKIKSVTLIE